MIIFSVYIFLQAALFFCFINIIIAVSTKGKFGDTSVSKKCLNFCFPFLFPKNCMIKKKKHFFDNIFLHLIFAFFFRFFYASIKISHLLKMMMLPCICVQSPTDTHTYKNMIFCHHFFCFNNKKKNCSKIG